MIRFISLRLVIAAGVLAPIAARANTVQFKAALGYPFTFVQLVEGDSVSMKAKVGIDASVNMHLERYPFSVGVFYEGFFKSAFGALPAGSTGVLLNYYPFGRVHTRDNISNRVLVSKTGLSVYFTAGSGLTFLNIRPQESQNALAFGASAFNFRLAANVDYPISETLLMGFSVSYFKTILGTADDGTEQVDVGVTGYVFGLSFSYLVH